MKIKSIDIKNFGKFSDFHLDFSDDMTLILGANEMGKTTIMSFIRMMFYGNTGKASGIDKNPRKKYHPWNGGIMAGSVTFEFGKNTYRLEREFKGSNSADKIMLIDLVTGETKALSGSDDIGGRFFGLTDGAFDRSVFLSDTGMPVKNEAADGEINARLSNIASSGDEDVSYEKVQLRLTKAKESLISKSRKIGKLDKTLAEIAMIDEKIKSAEEKEKDICQLQELADAKEEELKSASAESTRLFALLKDADKLKKRIFVQRYIDAEKAKQGFEENLRLKDGNIADFEFVDTAKSLAASFKDLKGQKAEILSAIDKAEQEKENLVADIEACSDNSNSSYDSLKAKIEELDLKIAEIKAENEKNTTEAEGLKPSKKVNPLFLALGAVFISAGILYFLFTPLIGAIIATVGLALFVLGFILKKKIMPDDSSLRTAIAENSAKLTNLLEEKQNLLAQISKVEEEGREKSVKLATSTALLEGKKAELEAKKAELELLDTKVTQAKQKLDNHICLLNPQFVSDSDTAKIDEKLIETIREYEGLKQRIGVLADHANCSSLQEATQKLLAYGDDGSITEAEAENIKERFKAASDISGKMRSELATLNAKIKALTESGVSVEVLKRQREELSSKAEEYSKYCASVDLANEVLEEAFRELRTNYSGVLDTKTAEIFSALTGNKYKSVNVSKNFDLNFTTEEAFGLKEAAYLSSGTEDQLYLALRLAITELITSETESLPLFMDDPLDQYDDKRAMAAMEFLKAYSAGKQLIMFTCHGEFARLANSLEINTYNL